MKHIKNIFYNLFFWGGILCIPALIVFIILNLCSVTALPWYAFVGMVVWPIISVLWFIYQIGRSMS